MYSYYTRETRLPEFIPLPKFIVRGEYSVNAKLLYGLLLSRTMLSRHSGWYEENGAAYVIYTVESMAKDLGKSVRTAAQALKELSDNGLVEKVHQGTGRPNKLLLRLPSEEADESYIYIPQILQL
jgi:DNA-binding transcriptional ArsR family regulator